MNKKNYLAPSIQEVSLAMTAKICDGSNQVNNVNGGDTGIGGTPQPGTGQGGSKPRSNDRGNDGEWGNLW